MRPSPDEIRLFNDSVDCCVANPRFMDIFYDRFIGGSEDVAARFADTDMERQKRALKASLYTAMLAADGNGPAIDHLLELSRGHRERAIEAHHYDLWLDCLLATVRECGAPTDVRVEKAWRGVLAFAIELMKTGRAAFGQAGSGRAAPRDRQGTPEPPLEARSAC